MKKIYIPYIVFGVIVLTLFVINTFFLRSKDISDIQKEQKNIKKENTSNDIKYEKNIYTVKASGNNIFLYDKNDIIIEKLNIDFERLREYDKQQFVDGIKIKDNQELYQLIEDFSN